MLFILLYQKICTCKDTRVKIPLQKLHQSEMTIDKMCMMHVWLHQSKMTFNSEMQRKLSSKIF